MTEQEYGTVRADESAVDAAREAKDEFGDSWADVFRFYAERRPDAGRPRKWTEDEIRKIAQSSILGFFETSVAGPAPVNQVPGRRGRPHVRPLAEPFGVNGSRHYFSSTRW